jgi:hypothetical protein
MSRRRWQTDQIELRRDAHNQRRRRLVQPASDDDDRLHREVLNLPIAGAFKPSDINAAFRLKAKTAHPDAGGCDERYRHIADARDALLTQFASA